MSRALRGALLPITSQRIRIRIPRSTTRCLNRSSLLPARPRPPSIPIQTRPRRSPKGATMVLRRGNRFSNPSHRSSHNPNTSRRVRSPRVMCIADRRSLVGMDRSPSQPQFPRRKRSRGRGTQHRRTRPLWLANHYHLFLPR